MYSVEIDHDRRLIVITASGQVSKDDVKAVADEVREALKTMEHGLRALTDLRTMTSMDPACAPHIAEIMDALNAKHVISVTRIVPDAGKDIGFNILSRFHYPDKTQIRTFENMADALRSLIDEFVAEAAEAP
jgi:hypothetical protein